MIVKRLLLALSSEDLARFNVGQCVTRSVYEWGEFPTGKGGVATSAIEYVLLRAVAVGFRILTLEKTA